MIFTGIQPSGIITLGNYLGVIKNLKKIKGEALYSIVDLHALTSDISAKELRENVKFLTATYIACGLCDDNKIFIQSHVKEHSELAWILQCNISLGELERMTQFKDKSTDAKRPNSGLLTYPVLMAADILLYDADKIPVGEDQKQHLELTRNIAQKFNSKYNKELFTMPEPYIFEVGAKIYSLTEPTKKMSKSSDNPKSYISLMDEPNVIRKKIKSSVTDSVGEIKVDKENQPGVYNLLQIYATIKETSIEEAAEYFKGKNYGFLKEEVAEVVVAELEPLQQKIKLILEDKELLEKVTKEGAEYASYIARKKMQKIKRTVGLC